MKVAAPGMFVAKFSRLFTVLSHRNGPNPPLSEVPKVRAAVLGIYGENDQRITAGSADIEAAMRQNGKTFEKVIDPGAGHAFNNDTGQNWNEQAAEGAWRRTLDWFKKYLV